VQGNGYVDYTLDRLVLLPGRYQMSVAIYDSHILHPFDYRDREYALHVQPGESAERYGLIELLGHWTFVPQVGGKELAG
jgi:ABC-2 type transport system ATP-binding protein/lipopolysaccharide transport system ATP-binding protein